MNDRQNLRTPDNLNTPQDAPSGAIHTESMRKAVQKARKRRKDRHKRTGDSRGKEKSRKRFENVRFLHEN